MAVKVKNRKGRTVTLLNPAEKGKLYSKQLKKGYANKDGVVLSDTQKAFRSGYLKARKDSAGAYKSAQKKRAEFKPKLFGN